MCLALRCGAAVLLGFVAACARGVDSGAANPSAEGGIVVAPMDDAGSGDDRTDTDAASAETPRAGDESDASVAPGPDGAAAAPEAGAPPSSGATAADGAAALPVGDGAADRSVPASDGGPTQDALADDEGAVPVDPAATCARACAGCCDLTGTCLDGADDEACGGNGATCQNCAGAGQVCQSQVCAAPSTAQPSPPPPAPDASATTCDESSCTNLCVPYFIQCCRSDATCGCALLYPRGPCE